MTTTPSAALELLAAYLEAHSTFMADDAPESQQLALKLDSAHEALLQLSPTHLRHLATAQGEAEEVKQIVERAVMYYYGEVEAICKDDSRRAELPLAKARYRVAEDINQELALRFATLATASAPAQGGQDG